MGRAYEALSEADPSPELATVAVKLGRLEALSGQIQRPGPIVERALWLTQTLGRQDLYADALTARGLFLDLSGRADESAMHYLKAIEVARQLDRSSTLLVAQNNLEVVV
jgi:predicted RNA polymerase sigma factor